MLKKIIIIILSIIIISPAYSQEAQMTNLDKKVSVLGYKNLLTNFDYRDKITYVIGHKSPDSDTVGSAIAYAYLLNQIGIKAEAAVSGPINQETQFALDTFGVKVPQIIDNAENKQFVLVDHSNYSQAIDGMNKARIVGIVDHHGIGDVVTSEQINVRSAPAGAAASLVCLSYQECGVEIPKDMARVMLMSLLSDTRNMQGNVTWIDRNAYKLLVDKAKIENITALYRGMNKALASYGNKTVNQIFKTDYKEYEANGTVFCVANINAFGENEVCEMAKRMHKFMADNYDKLHMNMLFATIYNRSEDENENATYMVAYGPGAVETLNEAFKNYDGKMFFVFKKYMSRKSKIIPAIVEVLKNKK